MITLKKILFPTDFSECANQALRHAIKLAETFSSELVMLHTIVMYEDDPYHPGHRFPDLGECYDSMEAAASHHMEGCLDKETKERIEITKVSVRGFSASGRIIEYAEENGVDLIAIGTHGRTAVSHFLLGSVAEKVVRFAPCPVLTVGPEHGDTTRKMEYQRILVPIDFSEPCKNAVRYAVSLGRLYDAHLDFLHVVEGWVHPVFYPTWNKSMLDFMPDIHAESIEAVDKLLIDFDLAGLSLAKHVTEGKAYSQIVHFADELKSDLIVIATRGLGTMDHLLMGSTAEKVIRRAPCPVLSVKQREHEFVTA